MQTRVLSAVIRAGIIVRHIRHESLVSLYLFVHRIVLYDPELLLRPTSVDSSLLGANF